MVPEVRLRRRRRAMRVTFALNGRLATFVKSQDCGLLMFTLTSNLHDVTFGRVHGDPRCRARLTR